MSLSRMVAPKAATPSPTPQPPKAPMPPAPNLRDPTGVSFYLVKDGAAAPATWEDVCAQEAGALCLEHGIDKNWSTVGDVRSRFQDPTPAVPAPTPAVPAPTPAPPAQQEPAQPASAPAPAPPAQQEPAQPASAPAPAPTSALVTIRPPGAISLPGMVGGPLNIASLARMTERGSSSSLFPSSTVDNKRGAWVPATGSANAKARLPTGMGTFRAVFVGYRLSLTVWGLSYDEQQAIKDKDKNKAPAWSAVLSDPDDIALAIAAVDGYTFTPKPEKVKYSHPNKGPGHPSMFLELLFWDPEPELGFFQVNVAGKSSVDKQINTLLPLANDMGQIDPFPAEVSLASQEQASKTNSWTCYWADPVIKNDAALRNLYQQFAVAMQNLDPDQTNALEQFFTGKDQPISDRHRKDMHAMVALKDQD